MPKKKQILYPVFFMILVTVIFTSGLAIINYLTIDRINELESLKSKQSILYAANIESNNDNAGNLYNQYITPIDSLDFADVYVAEKDNQIVAYVYEFSGPGLWGTITGYVALNPELNEIVGVDFLSHSETPGLGGRISEDWYKEQFRSISLENREGNFVSYSPAPDSNVDAITGATLTSESVRKIFNQTIEEFINEAKGVL